VIAVSALGGAVAALGLVLVFVGLVGVPVSQASDWRVLRRRFNRAWVWLKSGRRRAVMLVAVPLVTLMVSGWLVAALMAAAAVLWLPRLLSGRRAAERRIARLEALADWNRRLANVLTTGAGIEQAIEASLATVPDPVSREVGLLVARLRARRPTAEALRAFGDDLDDPTADLVVAALLLAADRRGRGLARVLTGLAHTVEEEVAMRRGVEADRAQPRTTARWVTYITIGVATALLVFDRAYVAPFGTPAGQVVLALIGALFAVALVWMHRLTSSAPRHRLLPSGPMSPLRPVARPASGVSP